MDAIHDNTRAYWDHDNNTSLVHSLVRSFVRPYVRSFIHPLRALACPLSLWNSPSTIYFWSGMWRLKHKAHSVPIWIYPSQRLLQCVVDARLIVTVTPRTHRTCSSKMSEIDPGSAIFAKAHLIWWVRVRISKLIDRFDYNPLTIKCPKHIMLTPNLPLCEYNWIRESRDYRNDLRQRNKDVTENEEGHS